MNKFLGFFKHTDERNGTDIFAAWHNTKNDTYTAYSPIGQHSGTCKEYIDESVQYTSYKQVFEDDPQLIKDIIHIYCND
jgi:hypothetical protein